MMKRNAAWLIVLLGLGTLPLFAAPLKMWRMETARPDCRPGVEFNSAPNAYTVKLDEKTGMFGKWVAIYKLPASGNGCKFQVRHNAGADVVAGELVVCSVSWQDAAGKDVVTAYMEPEGDGLFTRTLRRPKDAVTVRISMGVRNYYKPVTFSDVVCEAVDINPRPVRIVVSKCSPQWGGRATCEDNLARMEKVWQLLEINQEKPDLVVFPETFLTRAVRNLGIDKGAQTIPGPHTAWAAAWAKKLNTNVVVSLREKNDGRYYNSAVVIDRAGKIAGVYRKTQLCISEYENGYDWGTDLPVFQLDFGKIGVLICWDLWFPEAARTLRLRGAEVIAYPIAATGRKHFDWMWSSRAMENGVVLAASIAGGDTCPARVVMPDGEVAAETYYQQTYAAATVDLSDLPVNIPWLSVGSGAGESRSFYIHERHPELYRSLSDKR